MSHGKLVSNRYSFSGLLNAYFPLCSQFLMGHKLGEVDGGILDLEVKVSCAENLYVNYNSSVSPVREIIQ